MTAAVSVLKVAAVVTGSEALGAAGKLIKLGLLLTSAAEAEGVVDAGKLLATC